MQLINTNMFDAMLADAQAQYRARRDNFRYGVLSMICGKPENVPTVAPTNQLEVTPNHIEKWQWNALENILNGIYELRKQLARDGETWVPVSEAIATRIKREELLEQLKVVMEPQKADLKE